MSTAVSILIVCSGNTCRSPAAELMLRHGVRGRSGLGDQVEVGSAGTVAVPGAPLEARMAAELRRLGLDPAGFAARTLDPHLVAEADLVLAAARQHRAEAVRLHPPTLRRAFTLTELARYLRGHRRVHGDLSAEALATLVDDARAMRGVTLPRRPEDDDIVDPMGRSTRVHRRVAQEIADLVAEILDVLGKGGDTAGRLDPADGPTSEES